MRLPCPQEIRNELPLSDEAAAFVDGARRRAGQVLERTDPRLALIVGPCSIHDPDLALDYAEKLKKLSRNVENFYLVMRVFLEKPRTRAGWKGIVYDPRLDGSDDIAAGLRLSRKLLLNLAEMEVPAATELLEPLVVPYLEDAIAWGLIGARTSASQPHRQMASGLPFPVGFKNDIHGELDVAICGIVSSRMPHSYLGIDAEGRISSCKTSGNPLTHLVLRGSDAKTNYDAHSVAVGISALRNNHLEPRLLIDCSHGNSKKDHRLQPAAFQSVVEQSAEGNSAIAGLMLESHLFSGKQPLGQQLLYGVSVTDSCLGWEETESLIRWADEKLSCRSTSMSSVQN
jgi:3-deoxy-7-phosphoheptulonate synthase